MTPIGHLSLSYITGKSSRYLYMPAIIAGGILPDIDFLFIMFDWFNQVHRVITHNLLFISVASAAACFLAPRGRRVSAGISLMIGSIFHLMIDSVMDNNPTNGLGIAPFWPLSDVFFSPFNLLHASMKVPGWGEPVKMIKTLVPGLLFEVPLYLASICFLIKERFQKKYRKAYSH